MIVLRTYVRFIAPFVALYGLYIATHGHLTPGGGFPAGIIMASAFIYIYLAFGKGLKVFSEEEIKILEGVAAIFLAGVGLLGAFIGVYFFQNVLPKGRLGEVISAGSLLPLNIAVSLKVFAGALLIVYCFLSKR